MVTTNNPLCIAYIILTEIFCRWNKLVQKPFEEGDDRGLKLLQAILQPLMLRRTKDSVDKDGRWASLPKLTACLCCRLWGVSDFVMVSFSPPVPDRRI